MQSTNYLCERVWKIVISNVDSSQPFYTLVLAAIYT